MAANRLSVAESVDSATDRRKSLRYGTFTIVCQVLNGTCFAIAKHVPFSIWHTIASIAISLGFCAQALSNLQIGQRIAYWQPILAPLRERRGAIVPY